jgi:putative exosortase-associated protein (TIGR04073 family)
MRSSISLLSIAVTLAIFSAGCAGPEQKLGRGINNVTEFTRLGEMSRSIEQTALWEGANSAYTTGVIRGFNRSLVRTAVGAFEIVTFPDSALRTPFCTERPALPGPFDPYLHLPLGRARLA